MEGRKILLTSDAVGGVWQYSCDLARELAGLGHSVTIAVTGPAPRAAQGCDLGPHPRVELVVTGLPLDWLCDGPEDVESAARSLAAMAREQSCDLVHCNSASLAGAAEWPVPLVVVAHGCVATWWEAAHGTQLDQRYAWHRELTRRGLETADCVVAPSRSYAATVARHYNLARPPRVVLNGRNPLAAAEAGASQLHGALTVGRLWDPVKNAALLDAVAGQLDVPFYAAGAARGPHGEKAELVHLTQLGEIAAEELSHLLGRQPVFVSAASFEPFGLAVLEAAAAGCALVLSDIPTFRELWDGAAMFAPASEADGFERAIRTLLDDELRRAQLGMAAQARSRTYCPAMSARSMAAIYEVVLFHAGVAA